MFRMANGTFAVSVIMIIIVLLINNHHFQTTTRKGLARETEAERSLRKLYLPTLRHTLTGTATRTRSVRRPAPGGSLRKVHPCWTRPPGPDRSPAHPVPEGGPDPDPFWRVARPPRPGVPGSEAGRMTVPWWAAQRSRRCGSTGSDAGCAATSAG